MIRAVLLALLVATPALAQGPMTGPEFQAYTEGRTLMYAWDGENYGGEDYLPGRRVRWSFLDGKCLEGSWYESADMICFAYDDDPGAPICWRFYDQGTGLRADLADENATQELYTIGEADEPLFCLGPEVGA